MYQLILFDGHVTAIIIKAETELDISTVVPRTL